MLRHPLKFKPIYKQKVWGGRRMETILGRRLPPAVPVGESWEISDIPGNREDVSVLANPDTSKQAPKTLAELVCTLGADLLGKAVAVDGHFPLLIKYIDARENLSVQVHPSAQYAADHPAAQLKSEAWYVVHADPGAVIYKGLKEGVSRKDFRRAVEAGRVVECLRAVSAKVGQCHYLPSGTVHALGAGVMVAEVQTPSDTTFRLYDWDRVGLDGKPRQLHVEEALACIDFGTPLPQPPRSHLAGVFNKVTRLVLCEHFLIEKISFLGGIEQDVPYEQMAIWMVLTGAGRLRYDVDRWLDFRAGQTLLLPAALKHGYLVNHTDTEWLEITVPVSGSKSLVTG